MYGPWNYAPRSAEMTDKGSLDGLEGLHQDLQALLESRLANLDRLWTALEEKIADFRKLLDKSPKNDRSRQALSSGKISIDDEEYSINEDFKQNTLQLADALELDEIEAARLFLAAQDEADELDRTPLITSIIRFHERRHFLLDCLRLVLKLSLEVDGNDGIRDTFREVVGLVLQSKDQPGQTGSSYWRKCLTSMTDIEKWLHALAERVQSASMLGQSQPPEVAEIIEYQRTSLIRQHESLGAILSYITKASYTSVEDFKVLLSSVRSKDKFDVILIHYIPPIGSSIFQCGSPDGIATNQEARSLHRMITNARESEPWHLRYFQGAVIAWWLAEYSGWYLDQFIGSPIQGVDYDGEAEARSKQLFDSLHDGAFQFMLSVCSDVKSTDWYDPARLGLKQYLMGQSPSLTLEPVPPSVHFQLLLMEQFETFADAFITNMPDTLRKLKIEEDDQRKQLHGRLQGGLQEISQQEMHLERFLVIISYAFEHRHDAAQAFWSDPDSNLFGFLQWASKRQSTPRVSAFCEMLRAISEGEDCANAAHEFLLEEGPVASGRLRRTSSISWAQIFGELQFYASKIRDRPAPQPVAYQAGRPHHDEIDEPESAMMLECYLRLSTHMCTESQVARTWILTHPTFHLAEILFLLCGSSIPGRLRACAFTTLRALVVQKTPAIAESVWLSLDQWVSGGSSPSTGLQKSGVPLAPMWVEGVIFEHIATGFEEPNAFCSLIHALVLPYEDDDGLNDWLPFPENLGSAYRMAGIEPYVDFVTGRVFGMKLPELQDANQIMLLRWNCLNFIETCLSTFNEDLVIFANKSNISVDSAMRTSSLASYVRLHPFARVMEWLFNEQVLASLFAAAHQDVEEVNKALGDSPLVLSLLRSIQVMNLVMKLQSTYLDIVRPIIKLQSTNRRSPVANSALASFEDSVLNNLQLVVDLGLYCGTGHQDLTIESLALLEKLSVSRKLIASSVSGFGQRLQRNKIIGILERDMESDRIAMSLAAEMQVDAREIGQGPGSSGYVIKMSVLNFLNSCLAALPNLPTVGHVLLGFSCSGSELEVKPDSLFAKNLSLFHAVLRIMLEFPTGEENNYQAWLMQIKRSCFEIFQKLWRSSLSTIYTMTELRANEFLFAQMLTQSIVDTNTLWDARSILDPDFLFTDSSTCFEDFLKQRLALFDYLATELRLIAEEGAPSLKARILSSLLGATLTRDGEQIPNASIFDLFDFVELEIEGIRGQPNLKYLSDVDFSICLAEKANEPSVYDLASVQELLALRQNELRKSNLFTSAEEQQFQSEALALLSYLHGNNQYQRLLHVRLGALQAWVQLIVVLMESYDLDQETKTAITLQTLQVILPKLEKYALDNVEEAAELAGLAKALVSNFDFVSSCLERGRTGDVANDRLFQLFRVALRGIHSPIATPRLRETFYNICYRYLTGMADVSNSHPSLRRYSIQSIKEAGERLVDVVCDDAYAGDSTCRVSAILLLDALVSLAKHEGSVYIIESLTRLNFIGIVVDAIKHISAEFRDAAAEDVPLLLSYYKAKLSLLLRISQTRVGAAAVINAGLFQSVRESQLFSVDPDLGLEIDNPAALEKYYELLLSVIRVINAAVLSRGPQNEQTMQQARKFLTENRPSVVAVFKRHAKIGSGQAEIICDLEQLVESFVLLITMTNFLDIEEETSLQRAPSMAFT
ncbi:MAG: hypothetical protein M1819_000370 [Sarea resinae]|nr:MAG: hypothetical protein M1819_000370 [Sarea resinae]